MRRILIFTILTIAILASCKKDDNILEYKNAGVLNIQLSDGNGVPIAGARLSLQDENDEANIVFSAISDANGLASFGELTPGSYLLSADDVIDGEHAYDIKRSIQVVRSETNEIKIVPSTYRTTLVMTITERIESAIPLGKDVKVALVKLPVGKKTLSFEEASERIVQEYLADGDVKEFIFKDIPINNYVLMVYTSSDYMSMFRATGFETLKKNRETKLDWTVQSSAIRSYEFNQSFSVSNRVYNKSTYRLEHLPYEGCSIFIINQNVYYSISDRRNFTSVSSAAVASALTDVDGKASLKLKGFNTCYAICFGPDKKYIKQRRLHIRSNSIVPISFVKY